jgi:hypothetical protein
VLACCKDTASARAKKNKFSPRHPENCQPPTLSPTCVCPWTHSCLAAPCPCPCFCSCCAWHLLPHWPCLHLLHPRSHLLLLLVLLRLPSDHHLAVAVHGRHRQRPCPLDCPLHGLSPTGHLRPYLRLLPALNLHAAATDTAAACRLRKFMLQLSTLCCGELNLLHRGLDQHLTRVEFYN